jgi:hypothetical protein
MTTTNGRSGALRALACMAALTVLVALSACYPEPDEACQQAVDRRTLAESDLAAAEIAFRRAATPRTGRGAAAAGREAQDADAGARRDEAQRQFEAAKAAVERFCGPR